MTKSLYSICAHNAVNGFRQYIAPQSVEIDVTNACNQACVYCNVAEYRARNTDVTRIHNYHKLIEQLATWGAIGGSGGVHTVTFVGGGEPTARKGYEYVVEQAVDSGFLTSIVTNGTFLDRLINIPLSCISSLAWVGVDIDSGDPEVYEKVRRSKQSGLFEKAKENVKWLCTFNQRVDIKVLLHPMTIEKSSLKMTFDYLWDVRARSLYFRLALLPDNTIYTPDRETIKFINDLAAERNIKIRINKSRLLERSYNRCYALYMLPIFSADGNIYLCCENRGDKRYSLGSWLEGDFRSRWNSEAHKQIYDNINAKLCKPCRPHSHNMGVQEVLDDESYFQRVFL